MLGIEKDKPISYIVGSWNDETHSAFSMDLKSIGEDQKANGVFKDGSITWSKTGNVWEEISGLNVDLSKVDIITNGWDKTVYGVYWDE